MTKLDEYLVGIVICALGVLGFVYFADPTIWNRLIASLNDKKALTAIFASSSSLGGDELTTEGHPSSPSPKQPIRITPDSTAFLNPAHIHQVDQPTQYLTTPNVTATANMPRPYSAPTPLPAAPHWIWRVGTKRYDNVVVQKVDATYVFIAFDGGAAQIDISQLPPDLQQMLNYNPGAAGREKSQENGDVLTPSAVGP